MNWLRFGSAVYWACFVAAFLAIAVWESFQPKRELSQPAERRWKNHGALLLITAALSTLLLRVSPMVVSTMAAGSRFGILNKPWLPLVVRCALTVVLLDLLQYWIHWSFHRAPWLWRVHAVHHSDPDYDVSTAARFHPVESLYTQGIRFAAIAVLAPPVEGVFAAELLAAILNLSVHANASLPTPVEKLVRMIWITPDLHRLHHSEDATEQQRNFGQTFPWWDRWFGTYAATARADGSNFRTGLKDLGDGDRLGIGFMLAEPFHAIALQTAQEENPAPSPDSPT
jgi:sterol desaturase/sphingolipid hydroxylase (fatty acid hydroxylase superfamily)